MADSAYNKKGNLSMAIDDTLKKQAEFWLEYSQQLSNSIRYVEALKAAQRSLAIDDTNPEAWYAQGTCQAMLAHYIEALADFEQALAHDANYVAAWDGKAWVEGILGHKEAALQAVNKALEIEPDYREAQHRKKRLEAL
jgi:tetratricopeptide (TPR) repeat protein